MYVPNNSPSTWPDPKNNIPQVKPSTKSKAHEITVKAINSKVQSNLNCNNQIYYGLIFLDDQGYLKTQTKITSTQAEFDIESDCLNLKIEQPVLESVLEFSDMAQPDGSEYPLLEDLIDIPEDSVVNTESSDGQGHIYLSDEESGGDHEKDEDYVMPVDDDQLDSDDIYVPDHDELTGKAAKLFFNLLVIGNCDTKTCQNWQKTQKGDFRSNINNAHTNSAITGNTSLNFITKMKPLTALKWKEPLGKNKSL